MFTNRFRSPVQSRHRVICEEKTDPGIVTGSALAVQLPKTIEPGRSSLAGANTDFEREDLLGKLVLTLEVLEQRPEIRDSIADGFWMIGVRGTSRQGLLESMPRCAFPERQVLPEEVVEAPDDSGADRLEWFQIYALPGRSRAVGGIVQRNHKFFL